MSSHLHIPKTWIIAIFFIIALIIWLLGQISFENKALALPSTIKSHEECLVAGAQNTDEFIVFAPTQKVSSELANLICNDPVIGKQFGVAKAYWGGGDNNLIQLVGKGIANLALAKEHMVIALQSQSTQGYREVATYPDFPAFFISLKEKPIISKQYLWGKKIGLLDYPTSRSGHIIPMNLFKQLNMGLNDVNIVYANSHQKLREMLARGEVDIISSYWKNEDAQHFSSNYITQIRQQVSGSKWYMKMDVENTDLFCAVQRLLLSSSRNNEESYFSRIVPSHIDICEKLNE